jgi:hypothetical protein
LYHVLTEQLFPILIHEQNARFDDSKPICPCIRL